MGNFLLHRVDQTKSPIQWMLLVVAKAFLCGAFVRLPLEVQRISGRQRPNRVQFLAGLVQWEVVPNKSARAVYFPTYL